MAKSLQDFINELTSYNNVTEQAPMPTDYMSNPGTNNPGLPYMPEVSRAPASEPTPINPKIVAALKPKPVVEKPMQEVQPEVADKVNPWLSFASGAMDAISGKEPDFSWVSAANKDSADRLQKRLSERERLKQQDIENNFKEKQLRETINSRKEIAQMQKDAMMQTRKDKLAAEKELSPTQAKQLSLYESGKQASNQYNSAVSDLNEYDPTQTGQFIDNSNWAPNFLKNDKAISAQSAKDAWIESFLRDASGAAIAQSERGAYEKMFFPQPGDPKDVVANKELLRQQKEQSALVGAGKAGQKLAESSLVKQQPSAPQTKVVNGVTYIKVPGGWQEQ